MKRILLLVFILICRLSFAVAPTTTTVTATLTDGNGVVWANATVNVEIVRPFNNPAQPNNNGNSVMGPQTVIADGTGTFSFVLDDNIVVAPSGTTQRFTVCPNATISNCSISVQVVHGVAQNLSASISADLLPITVNGSPAVNRAYRDSEVTAGQGGLYWRTSDNHLRGFDGTTWNDMQVVTVAPWNNITAPTGNETLTMSNWITSIIYGTNTGATGAVWDMTDDTNNTGINSIFRIHTGTSSTASPFTICAQGTVNCVSFNSSGILQAAGTATIVATTAANATAATSAGKLLNNTNGGGLIKMASNADPGVTGLANFVQIWPKNNKLYASEGASSNLKVLLGGQLDAGAGNAIRSIDNDGNITAISGIKTTSNMLNGLDLSIASTTINANTCTEKTFALTGVTTTSIISVFASYAIEAGLALTLGQVSAGSVKYRVCNVTTGNITTAGGAGVRLTALN